MAILSTNGRLDRIESATSDATRILPLTLWLTNKATNSTILQAGGHWDSTERRYLDEPATKGRAIGLEESQLEFTSWFADWLAAFKAGLPRERLALAGGERRGGKTFDLLFCAIAFAVDMPGSIVWLVSPTFPMREELERTIREYLPRSWYSYRDAPRFTFTFANGSTVQSISADEPEKLKRGRADLVMFNEAQMMPSDALTYGIPATIDNGGLAILAANPPRKQRGEWVLKVKEAIDAQELTSARFFGFKASLNTSIDQSARAEVGQIITLIDPKAGAADDEGAWLPVGDRAYPKFDKRRHLRPAPEFGDITAEFLARKGRAVPFLGGVDFQGYPHIAGVVWKVYRDPALPAPIFWAVDEILSEEAVEDDFLDDVIERGYQPETIRFIGDASGAWQVGKHTFRGRGSFDVFKARRFHIDPPQVKRTEQATHSKNPAIEDRLGLAMRLMEASRIMVDPARCPKLAEAFSECPLKSINGRKKPSGRFSHITDAATYPLYWLEPKPTAPPRSVPNGMIAAAPKRVSPYRIL